MLVEALGLVLLERTAAMHLVVAGDHDVVEVEVDRNTAFAEICHESSVDHRRLSEWGLPGKEEFHGLGLLIRSSVRLDRQAALEAIGIYPRRTFETLRPGNSPTCKRAGCLSRMWSTSRRRSVLLGPGRFGRMRMSPQE